MFQSNHLFKGRLLIILLLIPILSFKGENRVFRIVVMGDTVTESKKPEVMENQVYSWYLEDRLARQSLAVEWLNEIRKKDNTKTALSRIKRDVLSKHPDVVTLMYGTNDARFTGISDSSEIPLPTFEENLTGLVKQLKDNGIQPILFSPPPVNQFGETTADRTRLKRLNHRLKQYVLAMNRVALAEDIPFIDVFHNWLLRSKSGQQTGSFYIDDIHPSFLGHMLIADQAYPKVLEVINDLPESKMSANREERTPEFKDSLVRGTPDQQKIFLSKKPEEKNFSIPLIDLSRSEKRQIIVDKDPNQYLGHPTTLLLDNKTLLAAYPKGHGKGAIVLKKSQDAGLTWSAPLRVPENWATSKEVPTLFKMADRQGVEHLILFSGLYPIRMAHSEDRGNTWSPLEPIGDFGGIVAMSDVIRLKNGDHMAFFHDDGRFICKNGKKTNQFFVYSTVSTDGGLHWGYPKIVTHMNGAGLCEPGVIRSPGGDTLAMLLRENFRRYNSMVVFSMDEGKTWSAPREMPAALTGDRHQLIYAADGRLVVVFRDMAQLSPTKGDFVAWVGTWNDLVSGSEGQYRVRLLDNKNPWDFGYAGLERLPDGTLIATTYGHWEKKAPPYVVSVRFNTKELDRKARLLPALEDVFTGGLDGYPVYRIPAVITTLKGTILAFCEGRASLSDHAENDIVLKRSFDGGRTWSPLQVVWENGKHSLNNPTVVQDRVTGKILLLFQDYPAEHGERGVSEGYKGNNICRTYITSSTDEGATWAKPREITRSVKRKTGVTSTASGPGTGIQITQGPHTGRIVVPFNQGPYNEWKVYVVFSDDHGKKWHMGSIAPNGDKGMGNEVQVVELPGGNLLLNSRSAGGNQFRKTALSTDGGQTWSPLKDDPALPEPQCQGSILRFAFPHENQSGIILFANPASQKTRMYGTIRISYDNGRTWPVNKLVYNGSFAYSCLTRINAETAGLLFERDEYKKISFSGIRMAWLTGKE